MNVSVYIAVVTIKAKNSMKHFNKMSTQVAICHPVKIQRN